MDNRVATYIKDNLLKLITIILLLIVVYRQAATADDLRCIKADCAVMSVDFNIIKSRLTTDHTDREPI